METGRITSLLFSYSAVFFFFFFFFVFFFFLFCFVGVFLGFFLERGGGEGGKGAHLLDILTYIFKHQLLFKVHEVVSKEKYISDGRREKKWLPKCSDHLQLKSTNHILKNLCTYISINNSRKMRKSTYLLHSSRPLSDTKLKLYPK